MIQRKPRPLIVAPKKQTILNNGGIGEGGRLEVITIISSRNTVMKTYIFHVNVLSLGGIHTLGWLGWALWDGSFDKWTEVLGKIFFFFLSFLPLVMHKLERKWDGKWFWYFSGVFCVAILKKVVVGSMAARLNWGKCLLNDVSIGICWVQEIP